MEKITYKEAKERAPKKRDTWVRILLLNWWAVPLTYLLARYTKVAPIHLTINAFALGMAAAAAFYQGSLLLGAILYFVSFVFDGIDGKLSRVLKQDDTYRGMWDFLLDGVVCVAVVAGLALEAGSTIVTLPLLAWMGLHFLDTRFGALVHNLKGRLGIKEEGLIDERAEDRYGKSRLLRAYTRMQSKLERVGVNALPTAGEAAFLMFVVGPILVGYTGNWGWMVPMVVWGCLCMVPAMVGNAILAEKLAKKRSS